AGPWEGSPLAKGAIPMSLPAGLCLLAGAPQRHRQARAHRPRPPASRGRASSYTASTVSDLIADVTAANAAGGANTVTLVAGTTFTLTAVDNTTDGATGLPVIAAKDNLTIIGNGDVIARSTANGTPAFRLLD